MNLEMLFPYLTLAVYLLFTLWVGLIGYNGT
jgi:hypothetical protein